MRPGELNVVTRNGNYTYHLWYCGTEEGSWWWSQDEENLQLCWHSLPVIQNVVKEGRKIATENLNKLEKEWQLKREHNQQKFHTLLLVIQFVTPILTINGFKMSKTSQISNFRCKHLRKTLQLMLAIIHTPQNQEIGHVLGGARVQDIPWIAWRVH